jgi:NADP-dependent 3-hydroxy acid dehydrogenase YdfG
MKNVIITGSSSGFGLKAVKDFADKGNKVFATMRNPKGKNTEVKKELEAYSSLITVVDMDVTNDTSVKEAMNSILEQAGNINILINNAGIMYIGITEAYSVEQAKWQMETNYYGAIRTMPSSFAFDAKLRFRFNYQYFFVGWSYVTTFFRNIYCYQTRFRRLFSGFTL